MKTVRQSGPDHMDLVGYWEDAGFCFGTTGEPLKGRCAEQ